MPSLLQIEDINGKEQSWKGVDQHRTEGHRREVDQDLNADFHGAPRYQWGEGWPSGKLR